MNGRAVEELVVWTVYERPSDYPHCYVARKFHITQKGAEPTGQFMLGYDLDVMRRHLERMGLVKLDRAALDEPHIVESWI